MSIGVAVSAYTQSQYLYQTPDIGIGHSISAHLIVTQSHTIKFCAVYFLSSVTLRQRQCRNIRVVSESL